MNNQRYCCKGREKLEERGREERLKEMAHVWHPSSLYYVFNLSSSVQHQVGSAPQSPSIDRIMTSQNPLYIPTYIT